jgi:hypothetical protein
MSNPFAHSQYLITFFLMLILAVALSGKVILAALLATPAAVVVAWFRRNHLQEKS